MVEKVKVELDVPKELKEVIDVAAGLVAHFRNGGDLAGATAMIPMLMAAIDGFEKLDDEMKSDGKDEAAAYMMHKMWEALEKQSAF